MSISKKFALLYLSLVASSVLSVMLCCNLSKYAGPWWPMAICNVLGMFQLVVIGAVGRAIVEDDRESGGGDVA